MFTCTPFYLANFVFLFEVSLLPFCSTHRFRFLRLPLVSPIGCLVLADFPANIFQPLHLTPYTLHPILRADWTNSKPVEPNIGVPVHVTRIEEHVPSVVWVVRV